MNRDSKLWWFTMVGAAILALSSRMDLIDPLLPAQHTDKVHAIIELSALVVAAVSGKLATSPLPGKNDDDRVDMNGR